MRHFLVLTTALLLPLGCGDDSNGDSAPAGTSNGSATANDSSSATPGDSGDPPATSTTDDPPATSDDTGSTSNPPPGDSTEGDDDTTTNGVEEPQPPTNSAELVPWLEAGEYLEWTAESSIHDSSGPHFGNVRTYINTAMLESLQAGNAEHPQGAAAVKELLGDDKTIGGWSVTVKLQPDSAGGNGWYWYEGYEGSLYADGAGKGICTGCHSDGQDYFRSPFPLQ